MIRVLTDFDGAGLRGSHYSRMIRAHLSAYGTAYDFCRFYEIAFRRRIGIITVFNGSVTADICDGAVVSPAAEREFAEFLDFMLPEAAELPEELSARRLFTGYVPHVRTFFEISAADSSDGLFEPDPQAVFDTVCGGGADYGLWLTDTVRRLNLGSSRLFGYESAVLTVRFMCSGAAYITDVATPAPDFGRGYARELLTRVSKLLHESGFMPYLAADSDSEGYYRSLGFSAHGSDTIYLLKAGRRSRITEY